MQPQESYARWSCVSGLIVRHCSRGRSCHPDLNRQYESSQADAARGMLSSEYCHRLRRHERRNERRQDEKKKNRSIVAEDCQITTKIKSRRSPNNQQRSWSTEQQPQKDDRNKEREVRYRP